ncbi:GNAT family N-acetyltransferase [Caulobacter sp. RHG1]|uniref:GNAT family N-acetyltransferase n=1 Tax=Caulobacter sp. (strain RHG1) TaxID=2545762 RepID=UPI001552A80A|nr:GNAT family protein [Caulobacter sp. RHG1]NQE60709.1 Acetyltransferase, GNAT family [Caulobacter sp. RHG1]
MSAPTSFPPILVTPRLTLSPPVLADFEDSRAMWADPVVVRHVGGRAFTEEESWTRLMRARGLWDLLGYGYWAVRETSTGRYVGEVGFADLRRALEPNLFGLPEMGWVLAAWSHGQGFGTEAVRAGLSWIDQTLAPPLVPCIIDVENTASIALATKVGFTLQTHTTYKGAAIVVMERKTPAPALSGRRG